VRSQERPKKQAYIYGIFGIVGMLDAFISKKRFSNRAGEKLY